LRGRKPKPRARKSPPPKSAAVPRKVDGKSRQKAENQPSPELGDVARREWLRISAEQIAQGLLTEIDRAPPAAYCVAYGRWLAAEKALAAMAGLDPVTSSLLIMTSNGDVIQNPLVGIANTAAAMARFAAEFGMTPSARARVVPGGTPRPTPPGKKKLRRSRPRRRLKGRAGETSFIERVGSLLPRLTGAHSAPAASLIPALPHDGQAAASRLGSAKISRGEAIWNSTTASRCTGRWTTSREPDALNDTDRLELYVWANELRGHAVLVARFDNLDKGASGVAVQNLRLMLDLDPGSN
jgi:P27 family predicted phage terminase small subunit